MYTEHGINVSVLSHLESIGLIQFDHLAGFARTGLPKEFDAFYYDERSNAVMKSPSELRSLHCLVGAALLGVMVGSEKVQGDVGLIADHPAVMRHRRDVEQLSRAQLKDTSILEGGSGLAG